MSDTVRKFRVERYNYIGEKGFFDTIEEARDNIAKQIDDNPYSTRPYFIVEVKEAVRAKPAGEVEIQHVSVSGEIQRLIEKTKASEEMYY